MESLDNSRNIGSKVEPKEGERALLSSNTADIRSPSLSFNPNSEDVSREVALDYLASILVDAYFDSIENENQR